LDPEAKMRETWRDQVRPLVAECVESGQAAGLSGRQLQRYVNRSYPWGGTVGAWGLKVWRDECRVQLKLKAPKVPGRQPPKPSPDQLEMFA
jgi:hypothetical protein